MTPELEFPNQHFMPGFLEVCDRIEAGIDLAACSRRPPASGEGR